MANATLDYVPLLDGQAYDPLPEGGSVLSLRLFTDEARVTVPVLTSGPAVRINVSRYRFTFIAPANGTYYTIVEWKETLASQPFIDANDVLTFPLPSAPEDVPEGVVLAPDEIARRAGFPTPIAQSTRLAIMDALRDAQADVEAYLGQPVASTRIVEGGRNSYGAEWNLSQPAFRIIEVVPEVSTTGVSLGTFQITYLTGLDASIDPVLRPIRRYVAAHASALVRQSPVAAVAGARRSIRSVNVDGQGITYGDDLGQANAKDGGSGQVGTLPVLESLSRWKRRNVFQRASGGLSRAERGYRDPDDGPWL